MDEAAKEILMQIRLLRSENRAAYSVLEPDKTMDLVAKFYTVAPEYAKEWHRRVLKNDEKILELSKKLCK